MQFSIIVPVYNCKEYLSECVSSLLSQTFDDYEIIIVDDGSTDGTSEMCDELSAQNPSRIKTNHKLNGGQLSARLHGIQSATGKYLVFCDSDDLLRRDALEVLDKVAKSTEADMVFYNYSDDNAFSSVPYLAQYPNVTVLDEPSSRAKLIEQIIDGKVPRSMWSVAFSRGVVDENLIRKLSRFTYLRYGEDYLQQFATLACAQRVTCIPDVLYYWRPNAGSMSRRFYSKQLDDIDTVNSVIRSCILPLPELDQKEAERMGILLDKAALVEVFGFLKSGVASLSNDDVARIREAPIFQDAYRDRDAFRLLRPDIQITLFLLNLAKYRILRLLLTVGVSFQRIIGHWTLFWKGK